jgi:LysM repeat protein
MKGLRQAFLGIGVALASIVLVLGGFSLSLAEGAMAATLGPNTPTLVPTNSPILQQFATLVNSLTPSPTLTLTTSPSLTFTPSFTLTSTWTPSPSSSPTICPHPWDWVSYTIRPGDSLSGLATYYHVSLADIQRYNCLLTPDVYPGMVIWVPSAPTPTTWACGRHPGWVPYTVLPGDTLFHLSQIYGVSVAQLQLANCIPDPDDLRAGQIIYVPYAATPTPWPTYPGPVVPTATPTISPEPGLPSDTPVPTELPSPTEPPLPTDIPTDTPAPTDIPTPTEMPVAPG